MSAASSTFASTAPAGSVRQPPHDAQPHPLGRDRCGRPPWSGRIAQPPGRTGSDPPAPACAPSCGSAAAAGPTRHRAQPRRGSAWGRCSARVHSEA
eukprot:scaffold34556_cov129-Isochrysis_galbana.AAC.8